MFTGDGVAEGVEQQVTGGDEASMCSNPVHELNLLIYKTVHAEHFQASPAKGSAGASLASAA